MEEEEKKKSEAEIKLNICGFEDSVLKKMSINLGLAQENGERRVAKSISCYGGRYTVKK